MFIERKRKHLEIAKPCVLLRSLTSQKPLTPLPLLDCCLSYFRTKLNELGKFSGVGTKVTNRSIYWD